MDSVEKANDNTLSITQEQKRARQLKGKNNICKIFIFILLLARAIKERNAFLLIGIIEICMVEGDESLYSRDS